MKKKFSIVFSLFFLITSISFAQQNNAFTKDILPVSPEPVSNNKAIRNPNATDVNVQGVLVDKRAAKYYNQEDFAGMTIEKAKRINFIYINSYELQTPKAQLGNVCVDRIEKDLDLGLYNHLRKSNERVVVPVNLDGCAFKISLYSWEEIKSFK